ncbi:MAG: DUF1700 domain-containing protein [Clostridia bacterium]|nr:DUF1700 domain-containing protein [Clostridia bacterium]
MNKQEFLDALERRIADLPRYDVEERMRFYAEMIEDRMEEGCDEEEAVAQIGSVEEIAAQILAEKSLGKIVTTEKIKVPKRLSTWEIVLLCLGAPIWLSLGVAAFSVLLSLYAVLWSLVIAAWSVFGSLIGVAVSGVGASVVFFCQGSGYVGAAMIGAALICAGLSVFLYFGCKAATKGTLILARGVIVGIKKCFAKREGV